MDRSALAGWFGVVLALVTLLTSCRRESRVETARRRLAEIEASYRAWFQALPTCPLPPLGDIGGWKETHPGAEKIPATFAVDSAPGVVFLHGGRIWRDDARTYTQAWGHWGYSSFQHDPLSLHCRTRLGQHTILFSVRDSANRYQASAWPVDTVARLGTVLHQATGPIEERLFLLRVLQTGPLARRSSQP